jgi:hypothetical protein
MTPTLVITGLVPVIPILRALRFSDRDGRDKPGHDVVEPEGVIPGERSEGRGSSSGSSALFPPPCGEGEGWGSKRQSSPLR